MPSKVGNAIGFSFSKARCIQLDIIWTKWKDMI